MVEVREAEGSEFSPVVWQALIDEKERLGLLCRHMGEVVSEAQARYEEVSCGFVWTVTDFVPGEPGFGQWPLELECCLPRGHGGGHDDDLYGRDWSLETVEYQRVVRAFLDAKTREADYYDLWEASDEKLEAFERFWDL